jgi:L-rhamnose mutarotase
VKRVGFVCKVKEERIEEYKQHHAQVWPAMLDALRRTGWHNYSLFMRKDGLMFGYFETPYSYGVVSEAIAKEEASIRWHEFMLPFFEGLGQGHPNVLEIELAEVFHLD